MNGISKHHCRTLASSLTRTRQFPLCSDLQVATTDMHLLLSDIQVWHCEEESDKKEVQIYSGRPKQKDHMVLKKKIKILGLNPRAN